jgi:Mg-chelatase subunit ChlD
MTWRSSSETETAGGYGMSQLELNKGDDFIFCIDVSASMQTKDCPNSMSRIDFCKEKAIVFAREASKWDENGIDVLTFGAQIKPYPSVTGDKAADIISGLKANEGTTNTHDAINKAYELHKASGAKQTVCFIVTDGAPADPSLVRSAIVDITNKLTDEHEFAISFLTVGQIDGQLRSFLDGLDDNLKGAKYDIVDVKALEEVDFLAAFSGALHD